METKIILEQIRELIKTYKESGPFRLNEPEQYAVPAVRVINGCPEACEMLKAEGLFLALIDGDACIFSLQDLKDLGAVVLSGEEMDEIVSRHEGDKESLLHELEVLVQSNTATRKVH